MEEEGNPDIEGAPFRGGGRAGTPGGPTERGAGMETVIVSSSSKARARIRVCPVCGNDNPQDARFCEDCGRDLNELEEAKLRGESAARLEKVARREAKLRAKGGGRTILRRGRKQPPGKPQGAEFEKASYHSQYLPPGGDALGIDHSDFRADDGRAAWNQRREYDRAPQFSHVPQDRDAPEGDTSFIVGIVIAAALFVVFTALVTTLIVVLLR